MTQHAPELASDMDSGFEQDIRSFKLDYCNETKLIIDALHADFSDFVEDPILDVGAGFEAISVRSFAGHDITLLDKIAYESSQTDNKRVTNDFFDFQPEIHGRPKTVLFCHVLQYLDDNRDRLYRKIVSLDPAKIVAVVNDNTGAFGNTVKWAKRHLPMANPEIDVPMADIGYRLTKRTRIAATLACPDFETLAYYFGRLILDLSVPTSRLPALRAHLQSLLTKPTIEINQSILGYEK